MAKVYDLNKEPDTKNTYYEPRIYLVTNIYKFDINSGRGNAWIMSGDDYVK